MKQTSKAIPFSRPNLVSLVTEQVTQEIIDGSLPEGQQLPPEGEMVTRYGVSRQVIREAMRVLSTQGLVKVAQGCKPTVAPTSTQPTVLNLRMLLRRKSRSLKELIEVRLPLESEVASLAAQRATDKDILKLQQAIDALAQSDKLEDQIQADKQFHQALIHASRNLVCETMLEAVDELLDESRRKTLKKSGTARALEDHQAILLAVKRRQSNAAAKQMRLHINRALEDLELDQPL